MTRTPAQELQYARQALEHERSMREILQAIDPEKFADRRELMTEAGKLREQYSVHAICDALKIDRGTFYNHIFRAKGEQSEYVLRDNMLKIEIQRIFDEHQQILGAAKIAAVMRQGGTPVTDKKVRKLMNALGLKSIRSTSKIIFNKMNPRYPNLVRRNFNPTAPNMVWASDVTEFEFKGHKYYICAILDLFSRKAIACRISLRNSTHLVLLTLRAACKERKAPSDMLVFHSDRGSPFTSMGTRRFCRDMKINVSYSRPGTPTDNPVMESFFSSLKREKLYRCNCHSVGELYAAVSDYVAYYNTKRPHQTLGFLTPDAKEASYEAGGSEV